MTVSRTYKSPLREDQMEQTRERILETLADILASDEEADVTVATVAEQAKVSVRTAYRYFPTKDALFDEFNDWMRKRIGSPPLPTTVDDLPDMAAQLLDAFGRNERLFRASRRSMSGTEVRKRRKAVQANAIKKAIASHAPQLDESKLKQIGAVFHGLFGSEAWLNMIDTWGLTTPEAIDAVRWGLDAMITKLNIEKTRKGRK